MEAAMPRLSSDSARGAQSGRPSLRQRLAAWRLHHRQMLVAGFTRLYRKPVATGMTVAVIAISLALPASLLVLVQNVKQVSGSWQGAARISLFLKQGLADQALQKAAAAVRGTDGVIAVQTISADQALSEFKARSGFGDALALLGDNPLPAVLVVQPDAAHSAPETADALGRKLAKLPDVDRVRLDVQWLRRLQAILDILRRAVLVIGCLLGLAVILIVGNTIRLDIEARRTEIEVSKLIGATDRFIRRPFLYYGAGYGFTGGVLAWLLVTVSLALVGGPVTRLAGLYGSHFSLTGAGFGGALMLLAGGALLGWLGAWLAVARHLRDIEPS
ncbi:MAG TPA: permease-like cell division protein FtsX [Gammaproteobacteria bacterium]|nr:permease-like cell division protein FtsX [Gammaproteobacteria bacterium]